VRLKAFALQVKLVSCNILWGQSGKMGNEKEAYRRQYTVSQICFLALVLSPEHSPGGLGPNPPLLTTLNYHYKLLYSPPGSSIPIWAPSHYRKTNAAPGSHPPTRSMHLPKHKRVPTRKSSRYKKRKKKSIRR
jgi:hypothetical protein